MVKKHNTSKTIDNDKQLANVIVYETIPKTEIVAIADFGMKHQEEDINVIMHYIA